MFKDMNMNELMIVDGGNDFANYTRDIIIAAVAGGIIYDGYKTVSQAVTTTVTKAVVAAYSPTGKTRTVIRGGKKYQVTY